MTDSTIVYMELKDQIMHLKSSAESLGKSGKDIPAIARNIVRIMASVKMLELNIVDVLEIAESDSKLS